MIYVMSDIHGHERRFCSVLEQIDLQPEDTLYILGDVIDRNPHGIRILRKIMKTPNIKMLLGNHEHMMLDALFYTHDDGEHAEARQSARLRLWYQNGGRVTHTYLKHIRKDIREEIFMYLDALPVNELIEVAGKKYLLTHAAPADLFEKHGRKYDNEKEFSVWWRHIDAVPPNENYAVVFGHTGTYHYQTDDPPAIWYGNGIIGIDCGSAFPDGGDPWYGICGRLACLCLDDMAEYYSEDPGEEATDE